MSLVTSRLQLVPRTLDPGVIPDTCTHAYSTKRIRSSYQGACLRVRRASDNAEQDVGFSAGHLDAAALLAFCAGSAGYVTTWYSQLPGVGDATQSIAEFQPRICNNGVVDTLGTSSKAALFFANPERQLIPPNGYVATASSTYQSSTLYAPVVACDRSASTAWVSDLTYTSGGAYTGGAVSTTIDGLALLGEWFQVVLPNAVVVASLGIFPRTGALTQSPKQFTLAASADGGTTWTSLYRTTTGTYTNGIETRFPINATKAYDTFRIVVDATTSVAAAFATFALYGTDASPLPKEVSLVPFLASEVHGSYVANKSSTFNQSSYNAAKAFDSDAASIWISATTYTSGTGVYTGTVTTMVSGTSYAGEWVQITFPSAVLCQKLGLMSSTATRLPKTFTLAGSNDGGTTWTLLYRNTSVPTYTSNVESLFQFPSTTTFSTYRLICEDIGGSGTEAWINSLKLYGFEPPLTFLNVPSGSSPQAIVGGVAPAYEQNLVPASGYTATASTIFNYLLDALKLFDRAQTTRWASAASTYANGGGGAIYVGSVSTAVAGLGTVLGEWVQIQLPAPARLTRYAFYPTIGLTNRSPVDFIVVGSNDGTTWEVVDQVAYSGFTYANYKPTTFVPRSSTTQSFTFYRLIVQKLFVNATLVDIAEWELYGMYDAPLPAQPFVPTMTAAQHGWYRSSASSTLTGYDVNRAYDGNTTTQYVSANSVYALATGTYIGAATTSTNLGAIAGEYFEIAMPSGVIPTRIDLMPQTNFQERSPRKFSVVGSNDTGATWTVLAQFSNIALAAYTNLAYTTFTLPTITQPYKTLRLVIEEVFNTTVCAFTEVQYYGYEQPTFMTSASTHTTNAAVALVPPGLLANGYLAAPPGSALSEVIGIASPSPSTALQTITQKIYAPPPAGTYKLTRTQPSPTTAAYALDALSAAAKSSIGAAFSTRRLLATYRGPLLKIRRSSDNAELEWYGNPDTLDTFLTGGQVGYVAVWYDQSNQGKNATAPTTAEQPRLATDRGRYVVHFDGTSRANSKYLLYTAVNARSVWSQFNISVVNESRATFVGHTAFDMGIGIVTNVFGDFPQTTGSFVNMNTAKYNVENGAQPIPTSRWVGLLAVRGDGTTGALNTIARNFRSGQVGQTYYRDFTGTMSDLVLFTSQLTNDADAAALYASRAVNTVLQNTQSRGIFKPSLYGSAALIASLTDSAKRILVEGRLTRDAPDLLTLGSELARLGPSMVAPIASPSSLQLAGSTWPVPFDYVIKRGTVVITSGFSATAFFSSVKDTRPAVVVIDGNLTIDANATFTPPVRKLFTVLYVTGNLTVNGTISMTARGANHSGTGDSGGYVPPQSILILNGTRDGVTNPLVPATGGAGAVGTNGAIGTVGGIGATGGTGGGGAGGNGGSGASLQGSGAGGTSFSGGSGGGGSLNALTGGSGEANGGLGGLNFGGDASQPYGRGGGNPENGTGGTLVIVVAGLVSGNGIIQSNGSSGLGVGDGGSAVIGGGGSGGGSVTVLAQTGGELVGITATGGGRVATRSGLGGDGSARFLRSLSSPIISARVRDLSVLAANAVVSTWGSWTASAGTQPTYITGTDGKYEVAFSGALTQYLDAGPRVCNFATNEGFTIVLYFKFTSTDGNQVLFNCEQGGALIRIRRAGFTDPRIYFQGGNPSNTWTGSYTGGPWFTGTVWQTNVWNVAVYRYRRVNGTGFLQYIHNNVLNAELNMGASAFENAAYTTPRLGSSTFTGSMRFAAMWDRALSDAELTGLYTSLTT